MFKTIKVRKLEYELAEANRTIRDLKHQISAYITKFEAVEEKLKTIPETCKPGAYCSGCVHSKAYHIYDTYERELRLVHLCNRDGGCEEFIPKVRKEETDQ